VIRPSLPFDAIGLTVGSAEDLVISMVAFAKTSSKRSILLLDDVENICGNEYAGPTQAVSELNGARTSGGEPHLTARVRIVLLTLLETIRREWKEGNEMLVICTSKINFGKAVDRFDRIFTLSPPNAKERREVLLSHVGLFQKLDTKPSAKDPKIQALLSNMVDCTAGLSYAELTQYCRQALLINRERAGDSSQLDGADAIGFFEALKQQLQSSMPESLRSGVNSDFVDMKVISARDLRDMRGTSTPERPIDLPLYGSSAKAAWEELRRLIVVPICQAKALDKLMFQHGGSGGKVFAGGVLLTGPPGCGKSALAYHCAAIASALNPSVKLIDVSCTSLIHKEVGSSERSIHRLFKSARSAAPCIVLMDGIENVAAVRGNDNTTEGTMDRVLSTLLTELDGVDSQQFSQDNPACLAIIGITHNANWVDPALRRPGRLERVIELGRPEREARRKLVENDLKGTAFKSEDDNYPTLESLADHVAEETEGFTGAAVVAVCNEAKMLSSKEWIQDTSGESPYLNPRHIFAAIELQRAGQR
jgi:SpoVK/Ycf46/Vps4 family AAA+-type ATPase